MPSLSPDDIARLTDYVAGELTPDAMVETERWIAVDPERKALVDDLQRSQHNRRQRLAVQMARIDVAENVRAITAEAVRRTTRASQDSPTNRLTERRRRSVPHVRKALFGVGTAALVFIFSLAIRRADQQRHVVQQFHTGPGERSIVRLGDGSTMSLAPTTSVTVTSHGFEVAGEVYFSVKQNPRRPFVVKTRNAVVQVVGTRFSVRQYAAERTSQVVVEDGKVALHTLAMLRAPNSPSTILTARTLAQVTDSGIFVTRGIAVQDYTSWTHGTLVFNSVTLREVAAALTRAYGVAVQVDDTTLAKKGMTMEVSVPEQPITRVLELIGEAVDAHCVKRGATYVLSPGRIANRAPAHPSSHVPRRNQIFQLEKSYGK